MSESIFLRVSHDIAKKQLQNRIDLANNDFTFRGSRSAHLQWYQMNLRTLEEMFSTDQIANDYKQSAPLPATGSVNYQSILNQQEFLKQLVSSLPMFHVSSPVTRRESDVPTAELLASAIASKLGNAPTSSLATKWEFHSVIVDDPTLGAHIEKPVYEQTLKRLADDGWELVSAVPVIYTEEKGRMFLQARVEAYRLFFKRPARISS